MYTARRLAFDLASGRFPGIRLMQRGSRSVVPRGSAAACGEKGLPGEDPRLRGYAVLTNEVEAILVGIAGVRDACVVAKALPAGGELLVAFLVP
jgi:hypothetical protein